MNAIQTLLTEHIGIWTDADTEKKTGRGRSSGNAASVYGIRKLRELILELAVRGKLVPQDANDEPASVLLKRIQAEKAKLIAEGKIKNEKPLPSITVEESTFPLPQGWVRVKLGDVAYSQAGFAFKSNGFNESGLGLPLIRIRDVGQVFTGTYFDGEYRDEFVVRQGDYLISMDGEFRVAKWLNGNALLNQRVSRLIFLCSELAQRFIAEVLQARLRELQGVKAYTTVDHLSGGQISNSVIALPPVAEQHRIVAKVDELMALCDQLETRHNNAAEAHEKLVSHLLATLTQSQSAADFSANWQRIAAHFDTLFTTEASIDALKQTLLQLAVMGKLVPQNSNDEPSSALLKRIQAEKVRLIAEGKIKKDKLLPPISENEKLFELPRGWEWVRFGDVYALEYGDNLPADKRSNSKEYPVYGSNGIVGSHSTCFVKSPCIVVGRKGSAGALNLSLAKGCCVTDVAYYCIPPQGLDLAYSFKLFYTLGLDTLGKGIKPGLNRNEAYALLIAIPPLAEQHRIVAKVDEMMALCDQLKTRITGANQLQQKLADVVVEQAVA